MSIITRAGFDFCFDPSACAECPGYCCSGESGNIWVNQPELLQISKVLQSNVIDCIQQYCNRVGNRLAIKERFTKNGFACVFYDDSKRQCAIYSVRPEQCRRFPFWEYLKNHREQMLRECPGIREVSDSGELLKSDP